MKIIFYNRQEIELTPEEAKIIREKLLDKKIQFIEIDNQLINVRDIRGVFESEENLPPVFKRLPKPKSEKIDITKKMEELFNSLKSKGLFRDYENYQQFTKRKIIKNR